MTDLPIGFVMFLVGLVGLFALAVALFDQSSENTTTPVMTVVTPLVSTTCFPGESEAGADEECCDDCGEYSATLEWRADGALRCEPCQAFRDHPDLAREVLEDGGYVPDLVVADLGLDLDDDQVDADDDAGADREDGWDDDAVEVHNGPAASTLNAAETKPTPVILPPFARIFEATGWMATILAHVDVIRYYDHQLFQTANGGQAVGFAHYVDGLRWIDVATKGRSDIAICWTIAHEVGHLFSVAQSGQLSWDETIAQSFADRFLRDAAAVYGWGACR